MESSEKLREKIDKVMNGQIILFIKHGKVNVVRVIEDEMWEEMKN